MITEAAIAVMLVAVKGCQGVPATPGLRERHGTHPPYTFLGSLGLLTPDLQNGEQICLLFEAMQSGDLLWQPWELTHGGKGIWRPARVPACPVTSRLSTTHLNARLSSSRHLCPGELCIPGFGSPDLDDLPPVSGPAAPSPEPSTK